MKARAVAKRQRATETTRHHAPASRSAAAVPRVLHLQRGAGNHAVALLLSDGRLERDARHAGERVLRARGADVAPVRVTLPVGPTVEAPPSSGARPLSRATRAFMEPRFGVELGHVRLHTGTAAQAAAERLQARAFACGPGIWLGRGASEEDRRLMAHELAHVVQLGHASRPVIQRQPLEQAQAPQVRQAGPAEQREFVQETIRYLRGAAAYWRLARVDQATLDRVLTSWQTMIAEGERLAGALADEALRDELRRAYTAALRALMSRASGELHRPVIRLYLENIHRISEWAWPGAADFPVANEAQRRTLVQETTDALNAVAFAGYAQMDEATLIDVLTRLRRLVDEELRIIAGQLGGDQALRDGLQNAYVTAIRDLLPRAAASMGVNAELLYLRFRYGPQALIPDWADRQVAGITTPLPAVGVAPDPLTGEVAMTVSGVRVIFAPDGVQPRAGASTNIHFTFNNAVSWRTRAGRVTSHQGPGVPEARVRTRYGPGASAASQSGYGRGTTAADVAAGTTTLGFHEGSHGRDYLSYLVNNPFPTFTGADGQTTQGFRQAVQRYAAACRAYSRAIERFSELQTDCVGITIVDYYAARRRRSPVVCP